MTVWSTNDVYTALIARILGYVPTGGNPEMPATSLQNGAIGARCWVLQAPDAPTFPYITLRLSGRRPRADYGLVEAFTLEVDVWHRPRNKATAQALQAVADQVQAALAEYVEPTAGIMVTGITKRETIFYATSPADRDVLREQLWFAGMMTVPYVELEVGTS